MPQKRKKDIRDTPYRRLKNAKDHAIDEIGDYVDHYWRAAQYQTMNQFREKYVYA